MFFRNPDMDARRVHSEMNTNIIGDNNTVDNDMNIDINMMGPSGMGMGGCPVRPACEPVQERCIHKTIVHEVPQV